jgi:hypothetical protein
VKPIVLATAVAAVLSLSAADASAQTKGAATKAEVQSIQSQMQALAERLNRLEAANAELKTQNSELQALADRREAEMDYLKSQTRELREDGAVASNEISKVKGADWATKIKARGDLRYRSENIWTERVIAATPTVPAYVDDAADRYRHRIRARLGFDFKATDNVKGTLLLATGADDPRSSNQTLGGSGSRKSIGLDMAYVDWKFMDGGNLLLGKQPIPIFRPGQSVFYDGDYNPEGGAVKFDRGMFFGSAYGWWVTENYNADPAGENTDSAIFGLQGGMKFPLFGAETVLAANYYECGSCQGESPLFNNNGNGNTTFRVGTNTTNRLTYGYEILEIGAQTGTMVMELPLTFWANYAQNMASDVEYDTAWAVGAMVGKASNAKTWEAGLFYQEMDKDALFGQWIDSDFGDGRTDSEGWVLKGGYAPVKNFTVNGTYFFNTLNKDAGVDLDYDRLQLDLNYKF